MSNIISVKMKTIYFPKIRTIFLASSVLFLGILGFETYQGQKPLPKSDPDNGGLFLPDGFEAVVVVDSIGGGSKPLPANQPRPPQANRPQTVAPPPVIPGAPQSNMLNRPNNAPRGNYLGARHLAVNSNGDIFVKLRVSSADGYANASLRDANGDGKAEDVKLWGKYETRAYGTAMRIHNGYLYYSSELIVYRVKLKPGQLVPDGKVDTIVVDEGPYHEHQTKPIAFDDKGHIFVGWGAGSNTCQEVNRRPGSPGLGKPDDAANPCPMLADHGGIWMFDENKLNQKQSDGVKYATGLRSIVGMEWDKTTNSLYVVNHGRDDLRLLYPEFFTPWQSAMLPAEEFFKVPKGFDGGWPYYYYDQIKGKKVLNPEYGGDGIKEGNGAKLPKPLVGFPGHFAPNDILFYKGNQLPARYKDGAFIAMHGSTNRIPYPQAGYIIAFVPMKNGVVTGEWEVFADGFTGVDQVAITNDAVYRPMGLAEGPDGSIYISETQKGKIWRVMYKGDKAKFGAPQLAAMAKRKTTVSSIKTPDEMEDNLDRKGKPVHAALVYNIYCRACHQTDGMGDGNRFPPMAGSEWVTGDKTRLIDVVLNGLSGPITVKGQPYNEAMPAHGSFLTDKEIAETLTYIRGNFGNSADAVSAEEVAAVRKATVKK